jgi:tRNA G37 N-methylase Trm5
MFSGCGPYPAVLSKNAKAKEIYGVEINPAAHRYALENMKLNKLKNVDLFCGDVNDILPNLGYEKIALKSRWKNKYITPKLKQSPRLIEFFMPEKDMESEKTLLRINKKIKELSEKQIKIMIHMPLVYKKEEMSLAKEKGKLKNVFECIEKLNWLSENNDNAVGFIFHSTMGHIDLKKYSEKSLIENLNYLDKKKILENLYLENCPGNVFGTKKSILNIIKNSKLKHMCFDFAHYMVSNKRISLNEYKEVISKIDVYTHVVNHKVNSGKHCSRLRDGDIDFKDFAGYIEKGCVEVYSKSEIEAEEQIDDWKYFLSIKPRKKFDRIIMPLPKSAEDFLDLALKSIKKQGIIHFYDFLNENEFYKAKEKIKKACMKAKKKCRILRVVKCGQHAPRVFRICVDFKVD